MACSFKSLKKFQKFKSLPNMLIIQKITKHLFTITSSNKGDNEMNSNARIIAYIVFLASLMLPTMPVSQDVSGGVLPDFDLEIDDALIFINPETRIGGFTVTITNVAVDATITVELRIEASGFLISPGFSTVSVPPASSRTVNAAIVAPYYSPAQIVRANAFAEITHVNGVPASGVKNRAVGAAVILPRFHDVTPSITNISLGRGEIKSEGILFNNSGNSVDYIALEFLDLDGTVWAYPQVDYMMVEAGQIMDYPIIVRASGKAPREIHTFRYRIYPITDPSSAEEGELNILVVDEDSTAHGNSPFWGGGILMVGGLAALAVSHQIARGIRNGGQGHRKGRPTWVAGMAFLLLTMAMFFPTAEGFNGTITSDGNGTADPSPMTDEDLAIYTNWITLESSDATEQLVEVMADAQPAIMSYNRFQRVPAGSMTSFPIHMIVPKESEAREYPVMVYAETIEREGVEIDDGNGQTIHYLVTGSAYSFPLIDPLGDTFAVMKEGKMASFTIDVVNWGNANDTLNTSLLVVEGPDDLVDTVIAEGGSPLDSHGYVRELVMVKTTDEVQVLKYEARGSHTDQPVAGCTIVIVPEEKDDDTVGLGDPVVIGAIISGVAVIVIVVFLVVIRKMKGPQNEEDEEEGDDGTDGERGNEEE